VLFLRCAAQQLRRGAAELWREAVQRQVEAPTGAVGASTSWRGDSRWTVTLMGRSDGPVRRGR